jgi:hypothetical protein
MTSSELLQFAISLGVVDRTDAYAEYPEEVLRQWLTQYAYVTD